MSRPTVTLPPALFLGAIGLEVLLAFALPAANVIPGPVRAVGALLLGSAAALAVPPLFAALLAARFIRHEERTMAEQFGDAYLAYARRVRRWL